MELYSKHQLGLVCVILLLPALCTSKGFTSSRATYYGSPDGSGSPRGACGYDDYGRTVNNGAVAGVSSLWNDGTSCGACYQVKCKRPEYCDAHGSYVVVTDYNEGDGTDFIMSPRAYSRLGRNPDASAELIKCGAVDIEYRRVPCRYAGYNIFFKIHESSKYPDYIAIVILYVAGQYDVTAIELWEEDSQEWRPLRRAFGQVYDTPNAPSSEINLRFQVSGHWVQSRNPIPSDWKVGATYDSEIQLK